MTDVLLTPIRLNELEQLIQKCLRKVLQEDPPAENSKLPPLLTRKDLAELFSVSLPTIHSWSKEGKLKPVKIGRGTRYRREDVLKLFANKKGA